jgi:hypothetical protein
MEWESEITGIGNKSGKRKRENLNKENKLECQEMT